MLGGVRFRKIILVALVLLAVQAAHADRILLIDLEVYKNDSVVERYVKVSEGNPTHMADSGDYRLEIMDDSGRLLRKEPLFLGFTIYSDPPTPTKRSIINRRIPYSPEMRQIKVFRDGELIYSKDISVCDNNGACDMRYESYLSCPKDCPLDKKDGICTKKKDGICDPDCLRGADPDCAEKEKTESSLEYLLYSALIVVFIAIAFKVYRRKRTSSGAE